LAQFWHGVDAQKGKRENHHVKEQIGGSIYSKRKKLFGTKRMLQKGVQKAMQKGDMISEHNLIKILCQ
jgi:hypothetical protein